MIEFSCGDDAKTNIIHALQCIPHDEVEGMKILFVCVDLSDARRLVMEQYEDFEIIVISELVVPRNWRTEEEWSKKYFNFVILHEVAHALLKHKSPRFLTEEKFLEQENEADTLAMSWLNEYLISKGMNIYSQNEVQDAQRRVKETLQKSRPCVPGVSPAQHH